MNVGFVGLGKLGLPVAQTIAKYHDVRGWDAKGVSHGDATCVADCVRDTDIVFVAVQTPHAPAYDGASRLPTERRDFEYAYLANALREVQRSLTSDKTVVSVISTVLPGTCARLVSIPAAQFAYNPSFVAMGTVEADFLNPEFVLVGSDDLQPVTRLTEFYASIHDAAVVHTSVASAELTKVAYNTFVGAKVVFANTIMELAHATGADCDEVTDALGHATQRLWSARYLRGGMGDGGPCHPRDNIALSHLARSHSLSFDLFGALMEAREAQTAWLGQLAKQWAELSGLEVCVLGMSYKAESELIDGSPAYLLVEMLMADGLPVLWRDPIVRPTDSLPEDPQVFVIATNHEQFAGYIYPPGSVVLDPWGMVDDQEGVTVVRIGRK